MKKITYEDATQLLIVFITDCDVDELAYVFGETFGYDVSVDGEAGQLECTPNVDCGFILEGGENVTFSDDQHRT